MNILAIDTVFNKCSVAIINASSNDNKRSIKLLSHLEETGKRQQTRQILPLIDKVLANSKLALTDISVLVFNRGPGAFSGIRINTAVVQALSVAHDIPCVGISSLQLLAQAAYDKQLAKQDDLAQLQSLYSIIDARMKQVYIGEYQCIDGIMLPKTEDTLADSTTNNTTINNKNGCEYLLDYDATTKKNLPIVTLLGDDKDLLNSHNAQLLIAEVETDAVILARLGLHQFKQNGGVSAEQALPVYIRNNAWKTLKEQGKK